MLENIILIIGGIIIGAITLILGISLIVFLGIAIRYCWVCFWKIFGFYAHVDITISIFNIRNYIHIKATD